MKLKIKIMLSLCLMCLLSPMIAAAQIPYDTFFIDVQTGQAIMTQPLYTPDRVIDGNSIGTQLSGPSDIFIASNDYVYIADTGNNRIIELDPTGKYIRSIGDQDGLGKLNQPEGVFVTDDGTIYAANTGDQTIVKYNADGKAAQVFAKPESHLLFKEYHFLPTKLVVDQRGVMYIVVKDTYQGLFRMNAKGEFTGFFGANKTTLSWMDRFKRMILSKEQLDKEAAKRPNPIVNTTATSDHFFLTTTVGKDDGQIKKLNAGGADAFKNKDLWEDQLVDVAIDHDGFMYGMDREFGMISIHEPNGTTLVNFSQGNKNARQLGVTSFPTSIAVNSSKQLWVADAALNMIQVFSRTSFGDTFLTATKLYYEGDYVASKPYWEEVIRENGMLNIAYNGLGKAALQSGDHAEAIANFKKSQDALGYSDAFWNVRYDWLQRHLILALALVIILVLALRYAIRKWRQYTRSRTWPNRLQRYGTEVKDAFYLIVHPYEGFYRLKERNISWLVVILILLMAAGVHILSLFASGFVVNPFDLSRINIKLSIGIMIVPWATWVVANYLVSTIKGGEGRFREVFQASTYALVPYIVMTIPIIVLTNIIVFEEMIVVDLMKQMMWIWIIVLFFIMTQVIHNFDFMETLKIVVITLFTVAVIWIFFTIMAGLTINLLDFIKQLYREVTFSG
ncbi:YIP1 family protein [Paenibacillus sp. GCM10027629]|uniref:YIP1 family protein n=1 Tax=Paenibacillus sp. GCM10027629 TaxID=3273414 RepID=UPI0036330064